MIRTKQNKISSDRIEAVNDTVLADLNQIRMYWAIQNDGCNLITG